MIHAALLPAVQSPDGLAATAPPTAVADGAGMQWLVGLLLVMSVAPFLITMLTSFAKLAIVGGLLRQAMGAPQTPPTAVITGLAVVLSIHVMAPVVGAVQHRLAAHAGEFTPQAVIDATEPPIREFLTRNTQPDYIEMFRRLANELDPQREAAPSAVIETVTILAPAFVLSELSSAFRIGFLLFLPFLVIDLLVGNVLQALGMMMMSPLAVSLPFKLLLFVSVDGWRLILQGVLRTYVS